MRVGVIGASGYAGSEVLRLCASHPDLDVVVASGESNAGRLVAEHVPALAAAYPSMVFEPTTNALGTELDVVFLALPHGQSQRFVPDLVARGVMVVDLGADFRLKDAVALRDMVRRGPPGAGSSWRRRSTDSSNATATSWRAPG